METFLKNPKGAHEAVRDLLKGLLENKLADAVLVAARTPYSQLPMPMLIADGQHLEKAVPLLPVAPFNAARQAEALLRQDAGRKLALVLRPCEIRALVELVKLNQCSLDQALVIGLECYGRMENHDFLDKYASGEGEPAASRIDEQLLCTACRTCTRCVPETADLTLATFAGGLEKGIWLQAKTEAGEQVCKDLELGHKDMDPGHRQAVEELKAGRGQADRELVEAMARAMASMEDFQKIIADCINCYNCRRACPVCYCKTCVFVTDVFQHPPEMIFRRAEKRGAVKLPTDTTMYHLTRLAHISHACVGCGHCTSVCPAGIPVADFFKTVARKTQELFDYIPGRDLDEPIPLLVFDENEK